MQQGTVRPGDVVPHRVGFRLGSEARRRFLDAFERLLQCPVGHPLAHGRGALRQAIELDARAWARVILGQTPTLATVRVADLWSDR